MPTVAPVIMVSGAAGHLGRVVLQTMAARGAHVVALDHRHGRLAPILAQVTGAASLTAMEGIDLIDEAACARAVAQTVSALGHLDGLAHCAGGFTFAKAADSTPSVFEDMFRKNVLATANLLRAALAPMRQAKAGSIVAVAATAALQAGTGMAAYAASKAGVLRIVESFAQEARGDGVRINAVLPSIIDTPDNRAAMPKADASTWVSPAKLAATISFFLSEDAADITGAALPVIGRV